MIFLHIGIAIIYPLYVLSVKIRNFYKKKKLDDKTEDNFKKHASLMQSNPHIETMQEIDPHFKQSLDDIKKEIKLEYDLQVHSRNDANKALVDFLIQWFDRYKNVDKKTDHFPPFPTALKQRCNWKLLEIHNQNDHLDDLFSKEGFKIKYKDVLDLLTPKLSPDGMIITDLEAMCKDQGEHLSSYQVCGKLMDWMLNDIDDTPDTDATSKR